MKASESASQELKNNSTSSKQQINEPPAARVKEKSEAKPESDKAKPLSDASPESPVVIKQPAPNAERDRSFSKSEQSLADSIVPSTWSNWAQVIVAGIGLFIVWRTLKAVERQAIAAVDSTGIAKLSMVASDRAYVHFSGCRWVSHTHIDDSHIFWRIRVRWINGGNTPTRGLKIYGHFDLRDDELPRDYQFAPDQKVKLTQATIAPSGVIESGGWDIKGTDLAAISQGNKHLYVWGRAVYRDVFPETQEHITKFCVVATNLTGDPLKPWDANTNPFDIAFAIYRQHNCADEDCDQKD